MVFGGVLWGWGLGRGRLWGWGSLGVGGELGGWGGVGGGLVGLGSLGGGEIWGAGAWERDAGVGLCILSGGEYLGGGGHGVRGLGGVIWGLCLLGRCLGGLWDVGWWVWGVIYEAGVSRGACVWGGDLWGWGSSGEGECGAGAFGGEVGVSLLGGCNVWGCISWGRRCGGRVFWGHLELSLWGGCLWRGGVWARILGVYDTGGCAFAGDALGCASWQRADRGACVWLFWGGGGACLRGCRTESRGAPGPWGCAVPHSAPQLCVVCPPTPLPVGAQGCPGSRKLPTGSDGPGRGETESNGSHLLPRPRPAPEVSRPPCRPAEEGSGLRPSSRTGSGHLIRSCQRGIFFWVKVGSPASPALASPPGEAGRLPKR